MDNEKGGGEALGKPKLSAAELLDLVQLSTDPDVVWNYKFPRKAMDRLIEELPPAPGMKPWLEAQLNETATIFVHWVLRGPERLSRAAARDQLKKVEKKARALLEALEELHPDPEMLLQYALWGKYRNANHGRKLGLFQAHIAVIRTIAEQASLTADREPLNTPGPDRAFDIGFTLRALMTIYIRVTGKAPSFYYGDAGNTQKDKPASPAAKFIALFFALLPQAKLARLDGQGRIPRGPPKTVGEAMALVKFDADSLKSSPNQILRYELSEMKRQGLSPFANSGDF